MELSKFSYVFPRSKVSSKAVKKRKMRRRNLPFANDFQSLADVHARRRFGELWLNCLGTMEVVGG